MTTPSRRDRLRPAELLGISAIIAVFTGLVVLFSTRELQLAVIFLGIAFIVVVVVLIVFIGAPQWIAVPAGLLVYLVCWRLTLRIVRRRSDAHLDRGAR